MATIVDNIIFRDKFKKIVSEIAKNVNRMLVKYERSIEVKNDIYVKDQNLLQEHPKIL